MKVWENGFGWNGELYLGEQLLRSLSCETSREAVLRRAQEHAERDKSTREREPEWVYLDA